jgi:hypothetical protein
MTPKTKPQPTRRMGHRIRAAREAKELSTQAAATLSPRVLHRAGGVLDIGYWELMRLAGYVTPEGEDLGEIPPEEGGEMTEPAQAEVLDALRRES